MRIRRYLLPDTMVDAYGNGLEGTGSEGARGPRRGLIVVVEGGRGIRRFRVGWVAVDAITAAHGAGRTAEKAAGVRCDAPEDLVDEVDLYVAAKAAVVLSMDLGA